MDTLSQQYTHLISLDDARWIIEPLSVADDDGAALLAQQGFDAAAITYQLTAANRDRAPTPRQRADFYAQLSRNTLALLDLLEEATDPLSNRARELFGAMWAADDSEGGKILAQLAREQPHREPSIDEQREMAEAALAAPARLIEIREMLRELFRWARHAEQDCSPRNWDVPPVGKRQEANRQVIRLLGTLYTKLTSTPPSTRTSHSDNKERHQVRTPFMEMACRFYDKLRKHFPDAAITESFVRHNAATTLDDGSARTH